MHLLTFWLSIERGQQSGKLVPLGQQALHILPLLLLVQLVQFGVRAMPGAILPGLSFFAGPFVGALLWLPLTFILLLPQYQPVDRDANRPI